MACEVNKIRKNKATKSDVALDFGSVEYGAAAGSNDLIIAGPKSKKKEKAEEEKNNARNRKRKLIKEKKDEKLTKKKRKLLAAVQERKKKKHTQEELFASLASVQLDPTKTKLLSSSSHINEKVKTIVISDEKESHELTVTAQKIKYVDTIHNKKRVQENYYSTDSESDESEDEKEPAKDAENNDVASSLGNNDSEALMESWQDINGELKEEELSEEDEDQAFAKKNTKEKTQIETKTAKAGTSQALASEVKKEVKKEIPDGPKRTPVFITTRTPEIEAQRSQLPIYREEQTIVEAINENIVTVVCGETGSGKTTQIPQFLYEAGYAGNGKLIGITEPRRVAAVSMAKRVGEEMGLPKKVSYQIRFEGTRTDDTSILYMTDGVLMKEMENDVMLKKYSVIMIDEAHERSMYSDVLIGMLSRIAPLRAKTNNPLKLIIMSATLRLTDFTHKRLFPTIEPKIIKVESRQFPVALHFEKRTPLDYIAAAYRKACRVHEKLPGGAILIFVSGQNEVKHLCKKLTERYPVRYDTLKTGKKLVRGSKEWQKQRETAAKNLKLEDFKDDDDDNSAKHDDRWLDGEDMMETGAGDAFSDGEGDDESDDSDAEGLGELPPPPADCQPLYCLPLYSLLSTEKQRRVFAEPPEGTRLCVVATNVAETSLTIPGVRYVVDTGFEKRRRYDPVTGVSQFVVARCSQASADQRAGRAGRVSAGHAYRLFSSQVYTDLEQFSRPEIVEKPADQLVLHLKSMNIVKVVNFPFPSSPDKDALEAAEIRLTKMGALEISTKHGKTEARITSLGRTLSAFPLAPAYAKVIAMANQHDLMAHAISLISALSVREPLINVASLRGSTEEQTKQRMTDILKQRRLWCGKGPSRRLGDLIVLLQAVTASEKCKMCPTECDILGMRYKAMSEVRKLRTQLTNIVNTSFAKGVDAIMKPQLEPPTDRQSQMLRQMMVAGLADRIAKRVDRAATDEDIPRGAYQSQMIQEYVFIDTTSVLYSEEPDYLLFQEITQIGDKKCLQTVMSVDEEWIPRLAEDYCRFGDMEKDGKVIYNAQKDCLMSSVRCWFGPLQWDMGMVERPLKININTYRQFAKFILAGEIAPALSQWTDRLIAPPSTMLREWAKLQQRTEHLLNALVEKEILSRAALFAEWKKDKSYLLEEYLEWVPEALHSKVQIVWPPIK